MMNRSAHVQLGQQKLEESSGGIVTRPGVAGQHICLRHSEVLAQRSSFRDEDVGRTAHGLCQIGSLPEVCFSDLSRYVASIIAARDMSGVRCKSEVTSSQPQ